MSANFMTKLMELCTGVSVTSTVYRYVVESWNKYDNIFRFVFTSGEKNTLMCVCDQVVTKSFGFLPNK